MKHDLTKTCELNFVNALRNGCCLIFLAIAYNVFSWLRPLKKNKTKNIVPQRRHCRAVYPGSKCLLPGST